MEDNIGRPWRKITNSLVHVLFIVIIFILPEILMAMAMPRRGFGTVPGFYVRTLLYIVIFYANYFYIVDNTLAQSRERRNVLRFVAINSALIIGGLVFSYVMARINFTGSVPHPPRNHSTLKSFTFLLRDGGMIILTIGLAVALRLSAKWQDVDRQRQQILAEQKTMELAQLKSQLNPHFLFNTLNTIYALVDVCPEDAKKAVHHLSGLLRYMLYEDVAEVKLSQETDFIENYVSLMRMRLAGREVKVEISLDGHGDAPVPPLLFIPLIENAFKYGTEDSTKVPVEIRIAVDRQRVICTTSNSFTEHKEADRKDSGIGLANLRRRLQLLYGTTAKFNTESRDNIFRTCLTIPLHNS